MTIAERVAEVRQRVDAAADAAGRDAAEVTLVAVAKSHPVTAVREVVAAGITAIGENRADELVAHREGVEDSVDWHFIGTLQTNKSRIVRPRVTLLHSLDRPSLVAAWVKGPGVPPPVLVQVDVAGEPQKGGVAPAGTGALVEAAREAGLDVLGLMAVPPMAESPDAARRWFAALRDLRDRIVPVVGPLPHLSMGMSGDFEEAIREGSTVIRLGTTIFGPRAQR